MKFKMTCCRLVTVLPVSLLALSYNLSTSFASDDLMRHVADGRAWAFMGENGREGRLTLKPDGTGKMKSGLMSMSTSWQAMPGGFCMKARMMGERCVELAKSNNGFIAYQDGKVAFTLSR